MATQTDNIRFIVTGFGPFRGVPVNPTTVLVKTLRNYLLGQKPDEHPLLVQLARQTRTILLETSAEDVQRQIQQIAFDEEQQQQRTNRGADDNNYSQNTNNHPNNSILILIHLGVDSNATTFRLEQCAYNTNDFRVPDERGYQPRQECIVRSHPLDTPFETLLNIPELLTQLTTTTTTNSSTDAPIIDQSPVVLSDDPGRFVCNYTYATSLTQFKCYHNTTLDGSNNDDDDGSTNTKETFTSNQQSTPVRSLFVHVPPFEVIPERDQLIFLGRLMEAIYRQVLVDNSSSKQRGSRKRSAHINCTLINE